MKNESKIRYSQYTSEELSKFDDYTIADLLWEEWKIYGKPQTLEESLLEYEEKHRIDYW